jgi:hypothetical protein
LHPKNNRRLGICATALARFEVLKKLPERDKSCPDLTCKRLGRRRGAFILASLGRD